MPHSNEYNFDLFLLPHQDDEFGAFFLIDNSLLSGRTPIIVFLTNGAYGQATSDQRNAESLNVLMQLGVRTEWIWYLGTSKNIKDQSLAENLDSIYHAILASLGKDGKPLAVNSVYAPSWEGGHPDHDAAALLAVAIGHAIGRESQVYQFPLYNSNDTALFPYAALNPIAEAGPIEEFDIPVRSRLRYLKLCTKYKSQRKTFIGLLPFIFAHYIKRGTQQIQALRLQTISDRPHRGSLLYERRGWQSQSEFEQKVATFRQTHNLPRIPYGAPS